MVPRARAHLLVADSAIGVHLQARRVHQARLLLVHRMVEALVVVHHEVAEVHPEVVAAVFQADDFQVVVAVVADASAEAGAVHKAGIVALPMSASIRPSSSIR